MSRSLAAVGSRLVYYRTDSSYQLGDHEYRVQSREFFAELEDVGVSEFPETSEKENSLLPLPAPLREVLSSSNS